MCTPDALRNGTDWVEGCALRACENSLVDANATVSVYKVACAQGASPGSSNRGEA
ncbi:hypothetical protein GQ44DRAFT_716761 [Phaeosphaeriaceae sp. PMI808]|nr:hypothetical protein GQ44DRAFT_716761 [Phaeosphaeriaceae sp. PMI808]